MVVGGVGRQCQVEYDYEMWLDGYVSGGHCLQSAITFTSLLRVVVGDHHHLHLDNWMMVDCAISTAHLLLSMHSSASTRFHDHRDGG